MVTKNKTSKYNIKKEMDLIVKKIYHIKQTFNVFQKIRLEEEYKSISDRLPYTSSVILSALFNEVILGLSKLIVDGDNQNLCIYAFLKKYRNNKNDFKEQKYINLKDREIDKRSRLYLESGEIEKDIEDLENFLKNNKHIKDYISKLRSKDIAHNDRKMNFNKNYKPEELKIKVTYEDIEMLIDNLFKHMNNIYCTLFKTSFAFYDDITPELKYLNNILKKDIE